MVWSSIAKWCENEGIKMKMYYFLLIYLELDIVLLLDIAIGMSTKQYKQYNLWLPDFVSLPQFTWGSFMRSKKHDLQLLTSENIYSFFEDGIIGGFAGLGNTRIETANRGDIPDFYNENESQNIILYNDAVSLYPSTCDLPLPHTHFRRLSERETADLFDDITLKSRHEFWTDECV